MRELRVTPIRNGTVIDHLPAGSALAICQVLRIPRPGSASTVSVVMNVPSRELELKDIIKVEDRELMAEDLERLAVLAPDATVNLIRDYHVAKKLDLDVPDQVTSVVRCPNEACISNAGEPVEPEFKVVGRGENGSDEGPVHLECAYCVRRIEDPLTLLR